MNIALVLQHKLLLGIQRLLQVGQNRNEPARETPGRVVAPVPCPAALRGAEASMQSIRNKGLKAVPLRVLRVVDSDLPRSSTGRMVISGRMADVCAELDRLVEREAALH
jgi:hypothetical protein